MSSDALTKFNQVFTGPIYNQLNNLGDSEIINLSSYDQSRIFFTFTCKFFENSKVNLKNIISFLPSTDIFTAFKEMSVTFSLSARMS